jgi:multidrug efflux pump subunit AcrB
LDNKQAVAVAIFASPGANALEISDNVHAKMAELKENFPRGVDYSIVYDLTLFVKGSIKAVIKTLLEAVALVVLVVILFLQTWRASIIPLLAVPVSIVGTFALMALFGFSINVLTLFGLILAIGIVVDDAIIVVENVQRNISEGLSPREASYKAMREVTGPIIATTLVLIAVFVPIAFISGLTGQFYRQFALTIAISTVISAFNSLTLSPAMSQLLLKPEGEAKDWLTQGMNAVFGRFFHWFNRVFKSSSDRYYGGIGKILTRRGIAIFPPPPVRGLGTIGGFKLQIEDRTDQGYEALNKALNEVMQKAYAAPELTGVFSSYKINVPQIYADVDRTKAKQLGLNINEIFDAMQVYLGSLYVNDFNTFGRTYQVVAQADKEFRDTPEDILKFKVRNDKGEMVPLGAVLKVSETFGQRR